MPTTDIAVDGPLAPSGPVHGHEEMKVLTNSSNGDDWSRGGVPSRETGDSREHSPRGGFPSVGDMSFTDASSPWWKGREDIVISGVSVRMPQSENMQEFSDNLMNGVDMVTEDASRWTPGIYDLPRRHGKIKNYEKMDAAFFGVTPKLAHVMDPQLRLLLEVAYEAILDSVTERPLQNAGTSHFAFLSTMGNSVGKFDRKRRTAQVSKPNKASFDWTSSPIIPYPTTRLVSSLAQKVRRHTILDFELYWASHHPQELLM